MRSTYQQIGSRKREPILIIKFILSEFEVEIMKIWKIRNYDDFFNNIIKVTEEELDITLNEKEKVYSNNYEIPKKNGKRRIYALDKKTSLYKIQKEITKNLFNNIMLTDCCYGFKKGCNYVDFLEPHIWFYEEKFYLRLDITNFFESINMELLYDALEYYVEESEELDLQQKKKIIDYIMAIVTYKDKIVQGAITSPVISNIVFRRLDIRIERYCRCFNIEYTRYADDLLFSSTNNRINSRKFLERIQEILSNKGFKLNYSKIRRAKKEISLNGYVVGENIRLSRSKVEDISRILFFFENYKMDENVDYISELNKKLNNELGENDMNFSGKYSLINYIVGNRAFLISVLKYVDNEKVRLKMKKIIKRLENLALKLA